MTYDLHPIFVHFPIALLTVYTLLELARLPIITRQQWWFYTKAILLFVGFLGGIAAEQTGEIAGKAFEGTPTLKLVELHSAYAWATLWVYGILALLYLIEWIERSQVATRFPKNIWSVLRRIQLMLFRAPILVLGSIAGMTLVTITGALGGALVYGPDADPVVTFFYHLLYK